MPNSFSEVNFIPDEVIKERTKAKQVSSANRYSIIVSAIFLIVGLSLFGYNFYLDTSQTNLQDKIQIETTKINELEEFGKTGYQLGMRLKAVKDIVEKRPLFSILIQDLYSQKPSTVVIENWQISDTGVISLSATSFPNYLPIADFQEKLKVADSKFYSDVKLRSASLDRQSSNVKFSLQIQLNMEALYESIK